MYAWRILLFMITLNLAAMIANTVFTVYQVPYREVPSTLNWEQLKSWTPLNIFTIGDIFTGFVNFVSLIAWVAAGFPITLANLGLPNAITVPLTALYGIAMFVALIQFITGRQVED